MKRLIILFVLVIVVIFGYNVIINIARDYEMSYKIGEYNIVEKYNKDKGFYTFLVKKGDIQYKFVHETNYSSARKLVKSVDSTISRGYDCLKPILKDKSVEFNYFCYNEVFVDDYLGGLSNNDDNSTVQKESFNTEIYNIGHYYYLWDGKGIIDLNKKESFSFLDSENYDNNLAYQYDKYLIFADYDQKRDFDKFYIFDTSKRKLEEWKFKDKIDFDSYFIGDVEGNIYLFDRKNSIQYEINIEDRKIKKVSNKDSGIYFDKEWGKKSLNEFKYYTVTMDDDHLYKYLLENTNLYLIIDNDFKVLVSNLEVDDILYTEEDEVYYIVDESVFKYSLGDGERKLIANFDWNFSYNNKIFIFD